MLFLIDGRPTSKGFIHRRRMEEGRRALRYYRNTPHITYTLQRTTHYTLHTLTQTVAACSHLYLIGENHIGQPYVLRARSMGVVCSARGRRVELRKKEQD